MLAVLALERVDDLLVLAGAERRHHDGLGLAAGEQGAAMQPGKDPDFRLDGPDRPGVAPVDTPSGIQDCVADDVLLERLEGAGDGVALVGFGKRLMRPGLGLGDLLDAGLLDLFRIGLAQRRLGDFADLLFQFGPGRVWGIESPGILRAILGKRDDRVDHRPALPLGENHRAQHFLFGQRLRFGFDHQHSVGGARDDHVERRVLQLVDARVKHILSRDIAHPGAKDRPQEGNSGDGQRSRGADEGWDIGIVLQIVAQHRADDLGFVAETVGEERPDRPVDEPRGQRFLFRRAAFALEETARDASGREGLLLVVDGKRKEIHPGSRLLLRDRGA